ncbi:hypothetical protein G3I24_43990 [Micromonospora aurantiaca]|nr:hypothetical protein [Micromonospora aurantiaca]
MRGGEDYAATAGAWLDLVRRARWGNHRLKLAALVVGSYAAADGTDVHCGVARLALDAEIGYSTARKYLAELRRIGLIELVARVRRRGRSDEYRLILGPDVLEHLQVPDPDTYRRDAREVRTAAQRPRTATSCRSRTEAVDNPGDNAATATPGDSRTAASGARPVPLSQGEPYDEKYGYVEAPVRLSHGIAPTSPTTPTRSTTDLPSHMTDVRTAVTVARAREAVAVDAPASDSRPAPPTLRIIAGDRLSPHPNTAAQTALWPAPVPTPEATVNAEQAKAHIRETLRGHRRAPLSRYTRTNPPPVPRADAPPPAPPTRGHGLCITCHLTGHPGVVAADPVNGDACPTHLHERNAAS